MTSIPRRDDSTEDVPAELSTFRPLQNLTDHGKQTAMDTTTHCSNPAAPLISVAEARSLVRTMLATAGGSLALVVCAHLLNGLCGELLVKGSLFQLYFN